MGRGKKVAYNTITNLVSQIITMISAFILPRLIMESFGSSYNGITSSVAQFLSIVTLLRSGVGGATRVALYKALAGKDYDQVSATINATELFMRKVAFIFGVFVLSFSMIYPFFVRNEFEWLFSSTLVLILSVSTFIQYYFGITYYFLLQADQRQYVATIIETISVILNVILSVILIKIGCGIHVVKIGSTIAFCITPIALYFYCNKHYSLRKDVKPDYSSIGQRWDALFHQVASFIHSNTDIVLLTIFSSTKIISVYTTYYLVGNGIKKILLTLSSGVESAYGDLIARNEMNTLKANLKIYENLINFLSSICFGASLVLITPFVMVYTRGISDVDYSRIVFGYLVIISEMLYCLRAPYESIINAAGHFKQTKKYAFIEATVNTVVSIALVIKFDLIGVVIGTIVAIIYRVIAFSYYSDKHITKRSFLNTLGRFAVTGLTILVVFLICNFFMPTTMSSYIEWIKYAIPVTAIATIITTVLNVLFYKNETQATFGKIYSIVKQIIKR